MRAAHAAVTSSCSITENDLGQEECPVKICVTGSVLGLRTVTTKESPIVKPNSAAQPMTRFQSTNTPGASPGTACRSSKSPMT